MRKRQLWKAHNVMGKIYTNNAVFAPYHYTADNCAAFLKKYITPGCSVLDVGTGTGVLALAAKRYGAGRVLATDIDPQSVECAKINCADTGIAVEQHDLNHGITEKFDITVANLYATPAQDFLQYARDTMADNGILILTWCADISWLYIEEWFTIVERSEDAPYITYVLK